MAARRFAAVVCQFAATSSSLAAAAQLFVFLGERVSAVVLGASVAAFAELLAGLHVVPLYKSSAWPALSAEAGYPLFPSILPFPGTPNCSRLDLLLLAQ